MCIYFQGLSFLHKSVIGPHGWLLPSNCIIDNRWVLKITDFGVGEIYRLLHEKPKNHRLRDYLYTSPEVLRAGLANVYKNATQESDVFSFAIIAAQTISKMSVFQMYGNLKASDIINKLKVVTPIPLRPTITKNEDVPDDLIRLLNSCWSENPSERPSARVISRSLASLLSQRFVFCFLSFFLKIICLFIVLSSCSNCQSLFDHMFHKLETYSNQLEHEVRERTRQLQEERNRTEQLIERMLPP